MKVAIVFLAVFAISYADRVNVVDNNGQSTGFVPDAAFYRPSQGSPPYGSININNNPDPAFYQPSNPGYEQPSFGPAFVNVKPPYPYKQYDNPLARGGK